jgi:DNA-directed RNA polymerase specialized sigma24 family protein
MNDAELLKPFVEHGSETAFRTLVERHLPLVLGTARRITANSLLAEDVAQTVFILLARKAPRLKNQTVLAGWLYRTTRFVSAR